MLTKNILPKFGHYHVNELTRKDIQDFLFELTDDGKNRTAQKLKLLLSAIFDVIVEDYTTYSQEYILQEINKIEYLL